MPTTLAAQLFTLRAFTKTPAEIAATLKRVRQIGYEAVQCSALGPIDPKELSKILQGEGLVCCATHVPWDRLCEETDQVIEEHRIIGCMYPALGSMPAAQYPRTAEGFMAFARDASEVARKFAAAGMVFGYHNHNFEFEKFDGRTGLDILIDHSDPALTFEIDTYWVQAGGGDPAAWIRRVSRRIPLVHLKDMAFGQDRNAVLPTRLPGESDADYQKRADAATGKKQLMAEVGEGNMNFAEILRACREAGVKWHIVEQDVCQRDPFESLAISLRNLRAMGLS